MLEIMSNLLLIMLTLILLAAALCLMKLTQIMEWEREERRKNHDKEK